MRSRKRIQTVAMLALLPLLASTAANAQKAGGTLRIFHRDSPANMSIHEEGTVSVVAPMMPVFNNLVVFNQREKQNRLDNIVPDLAKSWAWSEDGKELVWQIERRLAEDGARPIIFYPRGGTCIQPYVKGLVTMVNSIYNGYRMEDVWLDK